MTQAAAGEAMSPPAAVRFRHRSKLDSAALGKFRRHLVVAEIVILFAGSGRAAMGCTSRAMRRTNGVDPVPCGLQGWGAAGRILSRREHGMTAVVASASCMRA